MSEIDIPVSYTPIYAMPNIAAPLSSLGDINIDQGTAFVWKQGFVIFYSRYVSSPHSSWSYVVLDVNGNYTAINMPIKSTTGFVYSSITPLGYGFLVTCSNGEVYSIIPPDSYINNKTKIINNQPANLASVCGQTLSLAFPTDNGVFLMGSVPNSQNAGYIYTGFYDRKGNLVDGGLQGTYDGPSQTFYSYANLQSGTILNTLSNGKQSAVTYNSSIGLRELATIGSNYSTGYSTCGPIPSDLPFPGNLSGAYVTYSVTSALPLINNSYNEFYMYVDSNHPQLVGCVNPNYNQGNNISVLVTNGIENYNFISAHLPFFAGPACINVNTLVLFTEACDGAFISHNIPIPSIPPNMSTNSAPIMNFKSSVLKSFNMQRKTK